YLSEWHYKNIVTTGIRLGEMDWVHNFIEQYRESLEPEARENAYRFNLASYYYAVGHFDGVLELLTKVEYSDLRYNLGARALLLRTYYDLGEYEALRSLRDSFKQYLLRNKLMSDSRREGYYNLFKFTHRAALLKMRVDYSSAESLNKDLSRLKRAVDASDAIFNRPWLLEKIGEIEEEVFSLR
ncbi:MAG: hypothetical protein R3350_07035, partial [Saprospiraceae bacterium]|nr:hypothetical protein [Saprospiraceae bacterium]